MARVRRLQRSVLGFFLEKEAADRGGFCGIFISRCKRGRVVNIQHGGPQIDTYVDGTRTGKVGRVSNPAPETFHEMASPASSRLSESTLGSEGLHFSCLVFGLFARDVGLALVLAAPVSFLLRVALIALSSILLHIPMSTMHLHHSTSVTIPQLSGAVSARCKCHPKHGHLRSLTKMSWKTLSIPYRRC